MSLDAPINTPVPHDAAELHVTGRARYVDDIPVPASCLHLAFGLSDTAHGEITSVDLDAVRKAPGVVLVWTADDLPRPVDVSPSAHDEPLLATSTVHFVGQPIFLVAATTHLLARKAVRLAKVEIKALPANLTIEAAMEAGTRFEDGPRVFQKGDAAKAIESAPHVIEGTFTLGGQEHFYLEGQAAMVMPQDDGGMLVHSSTQHPTEIQHKVAEALGLPMSEVRVEVRRMGGGFGGKESQGNALACSCALVAAETGRPAKMRYDRDDDMVVTGKRHDFRIDYRVGADADGRLLGVEFVQHARCGWSQDLSLPVADRAMLHADNAYHLTDVRIESHRWKTNTTSGTAFRGFGGPQGMVGIERVMDHLSHALGIDGAELRRRNYYAEATGGEDRGGPSAPRSPEASPREDISRAKKGAGLDEDLASRGAEEVEEGVPVPEPSGDVQTTPYHMEVTDFVLGSLTERLLQTSDYARRREAIAAWNADSPVLKRGLAFSPVKFGISFTLTHLNQAGALVHVYQDGSIAMNHGGTEMGQGLFRKVAQVAAARFGVTPERVKITATDTAKVPNTSATAASSGSDLNGMAVKAACDTIRERLARFVAERAQADWTTVRFEDGHGSRGRRERCPSRT